MNSDERFEQFTEELDDLLIGAQSIAICPSEYYRKMELEDRFKKSKEAFIEKWCKDES